MLPVHAHLLRRAVASKARSALPGDGAPRALVLLADRVSPGPFYRFRRHAVGECDEGGGERAPLAGRRGGV